MHFCAHSPPGHGRTVMANCMAHKLQLPIDLLDMLNAYGHIDHIVTSYIYIDKSV